MKLIALSNVLRARNIKHVLVIASAPGFETVLDAWTPLFDNKKLWLASGLTPAGVRAFTSAVKLDRESIRQLLTDAENDLRYKENHRWRRFVSEFSKEFGHEPEFGDWTISGVGSNKLSNTVKEELRGLTAKITLVQKVIHALTQLQKKRKF